MSVQKLNDLMILSVLRNCTESLNVQKKASVQCLFQEIRNAKLFLEKCVCLIMLFLSSDYTTLHFVTMFSKEIMVEF